jgi:lipopolysaccharide biosynthesis glycosyltransferase
MSNKIHIAVTIDRSYVQHLGVMLCSLFENNAHSEFVIYLLTDFEGNSKAIDKLNKLVGRYKQTLKTIAVDARQVEGVKIDGHISKATYYRLVMPQHLQSYTSKVLYLDSDLVVKANLRELWNTELDSFPIAAVPEIVCQKNAKPSVFNAGVLLIDIDCWVRENITETALSFARNNHHLITHWDQDVLNAIFSGNWMRIPQKWNVTSGDLTENGTLPTEINIIH